MTYKITNQILRHIDENYYNTYDIIYNNPLKFDF